MERNMSAQHRKVAFITGASSGIGRGTAQAFVERGYATVLVDRDASLGQNCENELRSSGECMFLACDVRDPDAVRFAVDETVRSYGALDVAFNAAGIVGEPKDTTACSIENWSNVIAINLTGVWHCMRHQIKQMLRQGGGSIVNCASVAGLIGLPNLPAYCAAKHGVVGLTRAAALEYARLGIRVNAVCPGLTDTPMLQQSTGPERRAELLAGDVLGRLGTPAEIAALAVWLCEKSSSFINGQAIAADGGWTAR